MKYPSWAPTKLIELHLKRVNHPEKWVNQDLEDLTNLKYLDMPADQLAKLRKSAFRSSINVPGNEGTVLLGRLITDLRMKSAWAPIAKRIKDEVEFIHFWQICNAGILGWRGDQQLSTNQRKEFFTKIQMLASELSGMMKETNEFHFYSIKELVTNEMMANFLEILQMPPFVDDDEDKSIEYASFWLSEIIPGIHTILHDISVKAEKFSKEESLVRKPNSDNAGIHYFVRMVSRYLSERYGTPLHEVVAATTSVVFDNDNMDTDYVRKLVR